MQDVSFFYLIKSKVVYGRLKLRRKMFTVQQFVRTHQMNCENNQVPINETAFHEIHFRMTVARLTSI